MKEWSTRFADRLLKDNLMLEEFHVSLVGYDHFDEIVDRLRELGCQVAVDIDRRRLIVTCPQNDMANPSSVDESAYDKMISEEQNARDDRVDHISINWYEKLQALSRRRKLRFTS